jgi:hypothetical protein
MPDDEKLTPADPDDLASALAFALKFEGRKRWHDADAAWMPKAVHRPGDPLLRGKAAPYAAEADSLTDIALALASITPCHHEAA